MMKILTIGVVFLCVLGISLTKNVTTSVHNSNISSLLKLNSADAECWWWETCNQRIESIKVHCTTSSTVTRIYYTSSAKTEVAGTAIVSGGTVTLQSGYQTSYSSDTTSTSGCDPFDATRVNCPTDGSGKCTEYKPC